MHTTHFFPARHSARPCRLRHFAAGCLLSLGLVAAAGEPSLDQSAVDAALAEAAKYEIGANRDAFFAIDRVIRETRPGDPVRAHLESGLAQLAGSGAPYEARRLACRKLWIIGTARSLPTLFTLLRDSEHTDLACFALRNHPAPEVNRELRAALEELRGKARLAAINLLGDRRDPAAVEALSRLAGAEAADVAEAARAALGRIGTTAAGRALLERWAVAGKHPSPALLNAALQAAQRLETGKSTRLARRIYQRLARMEQQPHYRRAGFLGLVRLGGQETLRRISAAIADEDPVFARAALARIPELPGDDVTAALLPRLDSLAPERRADLLRALAERGNPALLPAARAAAGAEAEAVAVAGLEVLGRLGDTDAIPQLVAAVQRGPDGPREAALGSLRQLPGPEVNTALLKSLGTAKGPAAVALLGVLTDRRATNAAPALLPQTGAEDAAVAEAAWNALGRLAAPEMLAALLDRLAAEERELVFTAAERAVAQVARRDPDPARAAVLLSLSFAVAERPALRQALLDVLGSLIHPVSLGTIAAAVHDAAPEVHAHALRLLSGWPTPEVLPLLLRLAREGTTENQRILALRGAIRLAGDTDELSPKTRLHVLRELLKAASRDEERRSVLAALGQSGLPAAAGLIAPFLDEASLRAEAAAALVSLGRALGRPLPAPLRAALARVSDLSVPDSLKQAATGLLKE